MIEEVLDLESYEWPWLTGAAADHVLMLQRELETQISTRAAIFLDVNFWIEAREAAFGKSENKESILFLEALRIAVQSGRAFFPVTADIIEEFSKQSLNRFSETMLVVDDLSFGVVIVPDNERRVIETEAFFARTFPQHPPENRPVWTRFIFAYGYKDLYPFDIKVDDKLLIALAEKAWSLAPSIVTSTYELNNFNAKLYSERISKHMRKQEEIHKNEIDSYNTALGIEVAGAARLITDIASREFRRLAFARNMAWGKNNMETDQLSGRITAQMIAEALKKDEHRRHFGSIYVPAALHAGLRSYKGRSIKPNDLFDFRHAAAALPYCRAFFTEKSLKTLITSGHMRLDKLYDCTVLDSVKEAISWLGKLQKS